MSGWFPESSDERRKRLENESVTAERAKARREYKAKRRKEHADFQKKIDAEVEKHIEDNSPEAKMARLEKLHGSSSLLNAALGLEFAAKGERASTPWMKIPGMSFAAGKSNNSDKKENATEDKAKVAAAAPPEKTPRLTRPF